MSWSSSREGRAKVAETERAARLPSGRYRVAVTSGEVQLSVSDAQASGSRAPWQGELQCTAGQTEGVFLELVQRSAVTIPRPESLTNDWYVRASYRESEDAERFGNWNYSTSEPTLRLSALGPTEWRFELRRAPGDDEPTDVRVVTLTEGDDQVVD